MTDAESVLQARAFLSTSECTILAESGRASAPGFGVLHPLKASARFYLELSIPAVFREPSCLCCRHVPRLGTLIIPLQYGTKQRALLTGSSSLMPASSSSSTETAEGTAAASTSSSAEPLLDVYGFRLPAEGLDQAGREASDKEQEEMTEKWSKYAKQRSLPSASKLKRYCRRVCKAGLSALEPNHPGCF